ncbi:Ig domain containing protein [Escherichia phage MN05]|uniref:Ig-like domain-containing protein n=1 Tax=Escherichia phage MN05 TaxID=2711185 RepID=A0A858I9E4_9CAUD|nr:Ig domain containing protein [Escherichia phage MN05]QIN96070.1 hypothetical protein MN05_00005 [Escherichia phage MN05]
MTVSPASLASLETGATRQFTASAEKSDGSTETTGFTWSVTGGGTITQSGLYTAPSASQSTDVSITATLEGVSGTATISEIADPAPTIVAKGPITGKTGGSSTNFTTMFTVTNSAAADYTFVVIPTEAGTVSAAGALTLDATASGEVTVQASLTDDPSINATCTFTGVTPA